ncbi:MAG TPA: C39 family peptidase [Vicinamibacterales bacterium]|nr:C39 family peptidase [Vicinamibacterales bacterium]
MARAATALIASGFLSISTSAAAASDAGQDSLTILDVPFIPQSDQLCGGAAAAMVLRYWGEREVHAEDFAALARADGTGIRGDALTEALRARSWTAQAFRGDQRIASGHLTRGRPLIALIEDQPGRYHYVVLLAWPAGHVVLHDPARAPFQVVDESTFAAAWAMSDFWSLLVLPDPDRQPLSPEEPGDFRRIAATSPELPADGCEALVGEGVRRERTGDVRSADAMLSAALARCPASAFAARELAGLRFAQSRWQEAAQLASRAAALAPDDLHAWRLLASSRFIEDDPDGALRAWNRLGEPRIDLVRMEGLDRTPHAVVQDLLGLTPRTVLTIEGLQRARRRLAMLPAASATRVGYRPIPGGLAEIDGAIVERRSVPDRAAFAGMAAHALLEREVLLDAAAPFGRGTRWIGSWRWWDGRPRVGFSFLAPSAFGRSGLWRLDGFWEQQSYAVGKAQAASVAQEDRKRLALSYTDWMSANTRVALGVALDRWNHSRDHVALSVSFEHRLAEDRVAVRVQSAMSPALGREASFGSGAVGLTWRSSAVPVSTRPVLLTARAGLDSVSAQAPLDLWPGGDVGHARDVLLRAHPLLVDGTVDGGVFGRTLAHGGLELETRAFTQGLARVSGALFADLARAGHGLPQSAEKQAQIDVGFGLRVRVAGQGQAVRIDVAHGFLDGRRAISAGWQLPWPGGTE